ncbi:hypothetical protein [Ornithinibacillus halotolerans]|uniref:Uncharacterized protein n=1 Tax=Ornithinibacillus halotolerans TaxID=1274357 RepID=A0A916S1Y6_9BACI|nr:hypothetical protein [Ornithinibacillus halotolerans]GGA79890.1 hypothetical protein GCM10008025_24140 [Ornithinibacillus halotolerans]
MKKEFLKLIIIIVFSAVLFYFVNTMTPLPSQSSGNGNPAILLMFILAPLFCYLVILWLNLFRDMNINLLILVIVMIVIAIHWVIGFYYQISSFMKYKKLLQDVYQEEMGFVDYEYIDQITDFFSIHMNSQYFNLNTYLMFLTMSIFISILIMIKQKSFKSS